MHFWIIVLRAMKGVGLSALLVGLLRLYHCTIWETRYWIRWTSLYFILYMCLHTIACLRATYEHVDEHLKTSWSTENYILCLSVWEWMLPMHFCEVILGTEFPIFYCICRMRGTWVLSWSQPFPAQAVQFLFRHLILGKGSGLVGHAKK